MIEAYGKLPFYKDYINIITTPGGSVWQEWLLKAFGQKDTLIPQGVWPFLFFPARDARLVTGIIMQGSDGRRNFPFSLFVTLGKSKIKNQMKWAELFAIKDNLTQIFNILHTASDIDSCYATLSGLTMETCNKDIKSNYLKSVNRPDLKRFTHCMDHEFPGFTIISKGSIASLSKGNLPGNEIISKWEPLMFNPNVQT